MACGDGPADESLRDAWHHFCDRLKTAGDAVFKDANPATPIARADAFRFLTQNLGQAFDLALETKDPAYPQLHPFCTPTRKLGGDVADFTYRQAWIDGRHAYRITGRRGSARWLNVTVQGPRPDLIPGTDWPSLHEPFGDVPECNVFGHQLHTDADGTFELVIGGDRREGNWLPTTPGSRKVFIREAFDAWTETPTTMTIERIGMDAPRPVPGPEGLIDAMDWAGAFLTGAMRDWPEHSWRYSGGICDPTVTNAFPRDKVADSASDVTRGRVAAHMVWELRPDEALIVEMDAHDGFWIFGMGGVFVGSMDYLYRPVSYTPARTAVDGDGVVRFVIAHDDPGVHNWLDTQGFSNGNLTYRNLASVNRAVFRTRLVSRSAVLDELPANTALVDAAGRARQLTDRYHGVKLRYGM
ncbi:DUF1214 domain-containing protein [Mycobacterium yunnanensis]|uniref:DUF1214 domain-containing protein n=1 Tax=Mycobacterium yunnanensis TaxID=368477 RepID=A0A9X2Z4Z5_9MYCO|nr:DUF1214 domain-containing protein [Mycobacterium yunnanensis]MCV7423119.1 DUF1214 domain-containing protein [Mycobacterium yunnanensis]